MLKKIRRIIDNYRFDKIIKVILDHEGGLSKNSHDPGGITNYGISFRFLLSIDHDACEADIINMTVDRAKELYKIYFYCRNNIDCIKDVTLATKVLDMIVNMGTSNAIKILQKSINTLGKFHIDIDGILGPRTAEAINGSNYKAVHRLLSSFSMTYYSSLVEKNPELDIFLEGWKKRASW